MKNFIALFVLMSALVIWQGCSPKAEKKTDETTKTEAKFVKAKNEELVAKRAKIAKASAEKEEQRKLALAEKAKATPTFKDASGKLVYYKAEIDPSYAGGFSEMRNYLRDNIKYPEEARENGYEATVFVEFVVDAKGKVREVVASEVVGDEADDSFKQESIRVVSGMPGWNPGRQQGKAVDTSFSIPITFQLEN
jgi:TonB family protein